MQELPMMAKATYGSTSSVLHFAEDKYDPELVKLAQHAVERRLGGALPPAIPAHQHWQSEAAANPKEKNMSRIVRVFIADPNENIPLDKRIIYKSDEFHTDLTDQELFFEANPAALLAKHNEFRTTVLNKKLTEATGKEHRLEPARIRDLKMVVVDVATF